MIEIVSFISNAMKYEDIIKVIKECLKEIEQHGLNDKTKNRLGAACNLYVTKGAIDEDGNGVMAFINDIRNRQRLGEAFDNKQ